MEVARADLTPEQLRRRSFGRAVRLLAARPWSVADLRQRLLQDRRTTRTVVETVIARLQEYGYLDDERYAVGYAASKVRQKPVGRRRLKRELLLKRVEQAVADQASIWFLKKPRKMS